MKAKSIGPTGFIPLVITGSDNLQFYQEKNFVAAQASLKESINQLVYYYFVHITMLREI